MHEGGRGVLKRLFNENYKGSVNTFKGVRKMRKAKKSKKVRKKLVCAKMRRILAHVLNAKRRVEYKLKAQT